MLKYSLITLCITLLLCSAFSSTAFARTYTVDTRVDGADDSLGGDCYSSRASGCSLRAAIQEANARPGADEIIFSLSGVYEINLTSGNMFDNESLSGDLDITGELTITGTGTGAVHPYLDYKGAPTTTPYLSAEGDLYLDNNGRPFYLWVESGRAYRYLMVDGVLTRISGEILMNPAATLISGQYMDRVFDIHEGARVTLNRIGILRGEPREEEATLPFDRTFTARIGGGIRVQTASLILNEVRVFENFVYGMASSFDPGAPPGSGSGLWVDQSYLEINNSWINSNWTVGASGAGIYVTGGVTVINDTNIFDNPPDNRLSVSVADFGGGIYSFGDLTINRSSIINNNAQFDGGGVYHGLGKLRIRNSTFSENLARRNGGGLHYNRGEIGNLESLEPVISSSTFTRNTAYGGFNWNGPWEIDGIIQSFFDPIAGLIEYDVSTIGNVGGGGVAVDGQDDRLMYLPIVNSIFQNNIGRFPLDGPLAHIAYANCFAPSFSPIVSLGGNVDSDGSCNFTTSVLPKPRLKVSNKPLIDSELKDNGGDTKTYAITASSLAHNNGVQEYCPETDQRGFKRDAQCDSGAYELLPPGAFNTPYTARAGANVDGVLQVESRGRGKLNYEIVSQARKGELNLNEDGSFTYTPESEASGTDVFSYRACTDEGECSKLAKVSYSFVSPADQEIVIDAIEGSLASVSDIDIIEEKMLTDELIDKAYNYPFGVFFFSADNVKSNPKGQLVLRLQLASDKLIPGNAVVRKMNNAGEWKTLSSTPSAVESYAVIDRDINTLTLTLIDNDHFDSNPADGVIRDPVGLAVWDVSVNTNSERSSGGSLGIYFLLSFSLLFLVIRRKK